MELFEEEKHHLVRGRFEDDIVLTRDSTDRPVVNIAQVIELHSPTGFEWGYGGSGPADLAFNILLRYTDRETAEVLHQDFTWDFIAVLPEEGGIITGATVREWLQQKAKEKPHMQFNQQEAG